MCGIAGLISSSCPREDFSHILEKMTSALAHRGPDDQGIWISPEAPIALGNRRLSVIDLSYAGHQPMHSISNRFAITYNGEIYNFRELRAELESKGIEFHSQSDTEVVLEAVQTWGIENTLTRLNGMFAFALWDKTHAVLYLARDRFGKKPLYYGCWNNYFFFASELKSFRFIPNFHPTLDRQALGLFLLYSSVPDPYSIFKEIRKLPPASYLTLRLADAPGGHQIRKYWSVERTIESGLENPLGKESEAIQELHSILKDSVKIRLAADVSLGVFLSGGIDSSAVTALMQSQSNSPVKTFAIGFFEKAFNEAPFAKTIAKHLGTNHTEFYVTPEEAMSVIPLLPAIYDEPFADASQVPTYLVSKLARTHVKVCLSGDGGDEVFCGYKRYLILSKISSLLELGSERTKQILSACLTGFSTSRSMQLISKSFLKKLPSRLERLGRVISQSDFAKMYFGFMSDFQDTRTLLSEPIEVPNPVHPTGVLQRIDSVRKMMYLDLLFCLPSDILAKVDRASMSNSLEVRCPMLDHRIVEFMWRLPSSMLVRWGHSKWILRKILHLYIPSNIIDRPKKGFSVPLDAWLRGPLKGWAGELLSESRLKREGFLDSALIRKKWTEHQSGARDWYPQLWNVLMFESWLDAYGKSWSI